MALVRFVSPFTDITGEEQVHIDAENVGELCEILIGKFGPKMRVLLDEKGDVSKDIVILADRRNVHTLRGSGTALREDTEVLIMPHIMGG